MRLIPFIVALALLLSAAPPKCYPDALPELLARTTAPLFKADLTDTAIAEAIEADVGNLARAAKAKDNAAIQALLANREGAYDWISTQAQQYDTEPYFFVAKLIQCYNLLDIQQALLYDKGNGGVIHEWRQALAASTVPRVRTYGSRTYEIRDKPPTTYDLAKFYQDAIKDVREKRKGSG
jgi:hypothetical protein